MACRSSPARPPTQLLGSGWSGVAEDVGAGRHAFAKLVGEGGQRLLGNAERPEPIPGERQRDPASALSIVACSIGCRLHFVEQLRQPRAAAGGVSKDRNS